MTAEKSRSVTELVLYGVVTLCMLGGVGLTTSGLLVPNWVKVSWTEQIVMVDARIGLWQDELCDYQGCKKYWTTDNDYDSHPQATFSSRKEIRAVETAGVILAGIGMLALLPLWMARQGSKCARVGAQTFFFFPTLCAAFLCVTGVLMVSAKEDKGDVDWAPILSGAGSALLFFASILSCIYCRYDPTYGTDENPVNKAYVVGVEKVQQQHYPPQQQPPTERYQIRL